MSCVASNENILAIAIGLDVDYFDFNNHKYYYVHNRLESHEDYISDITISSDNNYLAFITSLSKQLIICKLPQMEKCMSVILPRTASKIRFTTNNEQILVADKSGDIFLYNVNSESSGTKLLSHLSLLLDVLQTKDEKYIITCDRDEKIKVSCYPNTYNIQTYCLGHKEFVNHIELLPHNGKYVTSSSGDGTVKVWDYIKGTLCYNINVCADVDNNELNKSFAKTMDEEGVDVTSLPIVHYAITKLSDNASLLAATLHSYSKLLIYTLYTRNNELQHKKEDTLTLNKFPTAISVNKSSLFLYDSIDSTLTRMSIVNCDGKISLQLESQVRMFEGKPVNFEVKSSLDIIKVLYKRKYDNVQEYQERKKLRLEKSLQ